MDWNPIATAPFDRDLEIPVIDYRGVYKLVFPCRRMLDGWMHAETKARIKARINVWPTHWGKWLETT